MGKNNFTKKKNEKKRFHEKLLFFFHFQSNRSSLFRKSFLQIDWHYQINDFPGSGQGSVDQPQKEFQFVEFGGKGFIKYNIVNMNEI